MLHGNFIKVIGNTGNVTEAALTLIIYFVMRNVLRAHLGSLFVRKLRTMTVEDYVCTWSSEKYCEEENIPEKNGD